MDEGTLKKEARNRWKREKNMGHAVGGGEFENRGQEPLRPQKRAQKSLKILFGNV